MLVLQVPKKVCVDEVVKLLSYDVLLSLRFQGGFAFTLKPVNLHEYQCQTWA